MICVESCGNKSHIENCVCASHLRFSLCSTTRKTAGVHMTPPCFKQKKRYPSQSHAAHVDYPRFIVRFRHFAKTHFTEMGAMLKNKKCPFESKLHELTKRNPGWVSAKFFAPFCTTSESSPLCELLMGIALYFVNVLPFSVTVPKSGKGPNEESTIDRIDPVYRPQTRSTCSVAIGCSLAKAAVRPSALFWNREPAANSVLALLSFV